MLGEGDLRERLMMMLPNSMINSIADGPATNPNWFYATGERYRRKTGMHYEDYLQVAWFSLNDLTRWHDAR